MNWEYLMLRYKRDTNVYEDSYIDQDLLSRGPREQAWDGFFLNPQYPALKRLILWSKVQMTRQGITSKRISP